MKQTTVGMEGAEAGDSMANDDPMVDASDLEALLGFMKAKSEFTLPLSEVSEFLKRRLNSKASLHTSPTSSTPQSSSSDGSISSGFPFSAGSLSENSEGLPFYFGTPGEAPSKFSEPSSCEANANKIERPIRTSKFLFPDDPHDESHKMKGMSQMGLHEDSDVQGMEQQMKDVRISEVNSKAEYLDESFFKKFGDMSFNVGVGESAPGKKFGAKQRVGRTPAKYKHTPTQKQTQGNTGSPAEKVFQEAPSPPMSMDTEPPESETQPQTFANVFNESDFKFTLNLNAKAFRSKQGAKKKHLGKDSGTASTKVHSAHSRAEVTTNKFESADAFTNLAGEMENIDHQKQGHLHRGSKDSTIESAVEKLRKEGKEFYNNEDYAKALDSFNKALEQSQESWSIYSTLLANRAAVLMMLDRYIEVLSDCEKVLLLDPKNIKICCRKGRALLKIGRLREAELAFARVLEACPSEFGVADSEGAKADAKAGMRTVISANALISKLKMLEKLSDYSLIASVNDELLSLCPAHYPSLVLKAKCMIEARQFGEARKFIEETMTSTHYTILADTAHCNATKALPDKNSLQWREDSSGKICANFILIVNFFLYIGSEMGYEYLITLKNIEFCKSSPSSVISVIELILADLYSLTLNDDRWKWVQDSYSKMQHFSNLKQRADMLFMDKMYLEAIQYYSDALKVDSNAIYWHSVIYCNRAACYMALSMFREALIDCHNSLSRQPDYPKAYLRRARVFKVLCIFSQFNTFLKLNTSYSRIILPQ